MVKRATHLAALTLLISMVTACEQGQIAGGIAVTDAYVLDPLGAEVLSFYATIENAGSIADTLVSLSSGRSRPGSIHAMRTRDGMMTMQPAGPLPIDPGETLHLAPGRLHGMVRSPTPAPSEGDTVEVSLQFARSGDLTVRAPVRHPGTVRISHTP